jgi:membrane-bound ClpP family serine protease
MRMNSARLARRWQEAGGDFARMAEALNEEIEDEIATKFDLQTTEARLETKIEGVRADLQATEARLETKIEGARADLIKWIGGMMVLQVIAVVGLVRLLFVP